MDCIKFTDVAIFCVTLEIAIAVVSIVPLTVTFGFFLLASITHDDDSELFYPHELEPFIKSSIVIFTSVYALQILQLVAGIFMLHSFNLMKINLMGTMKTGWFWLSISVLTVGVLFYLLFKTVTEYQSHSLFLYPIVLFLVQKVMTSCCVLRFNVSACAFIFYFPEQ